MISVFIFAVLVKADPTVFWFVKTAPTMAKCQEYRESIRDKDRGLYESSTCLELKRKKEDPPKRILKGPTT